MTTMENTLAMTKPTARFWNRIAKRYAKRPVADEATYQKKLKITREYLRPDMKVLEFGCGTGSTALAHAPFVDSILATDISSKMIEIAERKASATAVGNVMFERTDIDDFTAPDSSFDAVLGLSILHLLDDRDLAIAKVYAMLKPGGVFISSTACLGENMKIFKLIGPIGRFIGLLPMLRVFTIEELETSLLNAGFQIERKWNPGKNKGVFIVAAKPT